MAGLLLSGGSVFSQDVNIFGQLSSSDDDEEEEILHISFFEDIDDTMAEDGEEDERVRRWLNATELGLVQTHGNSNAQTFGFRNILRRNWDSTRLRLQVAGVRSNNSGEKILLAVPGIQFFPEERPSEFDTVLEKIDSTLVEQYFVEGRIEVVLSDSFFWNMGVGWDRNNNAGISNRYVTFGGLGNTWMKDNEMSFSTSYSASFTNRNEIVEDATRDKRFAGVRLNSDYYQRLKGQMEINSDFTINFNLFSTSDRSLNVTNAFGIALSKYLSLRISLQHLYESQPAFEEIKRLAYVKLINPDNVMGNGDEFFETFIPEEITEGTLVEFGQGQIRKNKLDSILQTALVISF